MSRQRSKLTDEIVAVFAEQARQRQELLSYKELAAMAGCTEKYVQQVMSRIMRGTFHGKPRKVDINALARELAPSLRRLADQ